MKLAITSKPLSAPAIHYCEWTQMYFEEMCVALERKDVIQNGHISARTRDFLLHGLPMGYNSFKISF